MAEACVVCEALEQSCCPPPVRCNNPFLQADMTQKWIFIQLVCGLINYLAEETVHDCTDADALKALGECYWCQGSVGKLKLLQAQKLCETFATLDCSQPVCWSPLELEATYTRLLCELAVLYYNLTNPA